MEYEKMEKEDLIKEIERLEKENKKLRVQIARLKGKFSSINSLIADFENDAL